MKNWKQFLKYVHSNIAVFSSQYDAAGFHWESNLFIYSSIYFTLAEYFCSFMRKNAAEGSRSLLGLLSPFCSCSFPRPSSSGTAHPPKPGLMKTLEIEDLHSSESCTVPMFWIPMLIIPGMAEGWEVFLSASLMFQANTAKSIPTRYSFPNPSMPGLSLHIKCSLEILPSQKITQLKLSAAFIWCSHYNSFPLNLYEFPICLLPREMYCTTAFLRLFLMVLIS